MDYPDLQLHVLEIFVEAQAEATKRRIAYATLIWGEEYRSGRFSFAPNQTELGKLPMIVACVRCRQEFVHASERMWRTHCRQYCRPRH